MSEETKIQHTPGPWVSRPEWQSPYGVPIYAEAVNERDEREHVGNVYRAGDARLIAAAPDLLEACRTHPAIAAPIASVPDLMECAADYFDEIDGGKAVQHHLRVRAAVLRAAIALAGGRDHE